MSSPPDPPITFIYHVYRRRSDLLPGCGVTPGPGDSGLGEGHLWHTGCEARLLIVHEEIGHGCCSFCLEMAAKQLAAPRKKWT